MIVYIDDRQPQTYTIIRPQKTYGRITTTTVASWFTNPHVPFKGHTS